MSRESVIVKEFSGKQSSAIVKPPFCLLCGSEHQLN